LMYIIASFRENSTALLVKVLIECGEVLFYMKYIQASFRENSNSTHGESVERDWRGAHLYTIYFVKTLTALLLKC
jgi:hypothetical protein